MEINARTKAGSLVLKVKCVFAKNPSTLCAKIFTSANHNASIKINPRITFIGLGFNFTNLAHIYFNLVLFKNYG